MAPNPTKAPLQARPLKAAVLAATLAYVALITLPNLPGPTGINLDWSWVLGLHLAWEKGLVHGKDYVWTYGPLGHWMFPDVRFGTLNASMAFTFVLHALGIVFIGRLAWTRPSWVGSLWCLVVFGSTVLLYWHVTRPDLVVITLAAVALADDGRWRAAALLLLAALAALLALIKANLGVLGGGILVAVLAVTWWRERDVPRWVLLVPVGIYCVGVPVLYGAVSGGLESFPGYVYYSLEMARGYSEAMSLVGTLPSTLLALVTVFCIVVVLPLAAKDRWSVLSGLVPCLIAAFLFFKHAMVRQDEGHQMGFEANMAMAVLLVYVCTGSVRDRVVIAVLQAACLMAAAWSVMDTFPTYQQTLGNRLRLVHAKGVLEGLRDWPGYVARVREATDKNFERARLPEVFASAVGRGTVDAVPTEIAEVFANGWAWRPRPIAQSYSAYTPALDDLNARHIAGNGAADHLLLRWGAIDGRHPFFEDPLSWREMLSRYEVEVERPEVVLLTRRAKPRLRGMTPLKATRVELGKFVSVPDEKAILVMEVDATRSVLGHMRSLFFRNLPVLAEVKYASGKRPTWRVVPRSLSSGVIVQPLPSGPEQVAAFMRDPTSLDDRVTALRLWATQPAEYRSDLRIRWSRLVLDKELEAPVRKEY